MRNEHKQQPTTSSRCYSRPVNPAFEQFRALTFDCYGTLIDWESGILAALHPILRAHRLHCDDSAVLTTYSELEAAAEAGEYLLYREILRRVVRGFGERFGFTA